MELHKDLPKWLLSGAKLLNAGNDDDWLALADSLGYKRKSRDAFFDDVNPSLRLLADWVVNNGNSRLALDILIACLHSIERPDVARSVVDTFAMHDSPPPDVFISYQCDSRSEARLLRSRLERHAITVWMDVGQLGAGDNIAADIERAIRHCKVFVACVTPKYIASFYCVRELSLADMLRRPILPVVYKATPWPPPGPAALPLASLLYVDIYGVGGHGGCGQAADLEAKFAQITDIVARYCIGDGDALNASMSSRRQRMRQKAAADSGDNGYSSSDDEPRRRAMRRYVSDRRALVETVDPRARCSAVCSIL